MRIRKCTIQAFVAICAASAVAFGGPPTSEEELIAEVREAIASGDSTKLDALTYTEGMSADDKAMSARVNKMQLTTAPEVETISIQPLPNGLQSVIIANGKKVEMSGPPAGMVEVHYKDSGNGMTSSSTPYTIINDAYYLVGPKTTDLGWTGPPDKNIGFMVIGQGQDAVSIKAQWNASGVTQTQEFSEPSSTFWGQHIDSMTVTSDSDDTNVTITILEGGETIYESDPLNGRGVLEYKRDS